jgi:hypothetical protein
MRDSASSYAMPDVLEPELSRLRTYWDGLRRGEANMPFSDDVDPSRVEALAPGYFLLNVFESPVRFRFEDAAPEFADQFSENLKGEFSDELDPRPLLEELTEQAGATVAQRLPTYFRSAGAREPYARILLPTWGDGHVAMLIGAVAK